MTDDALLPRFRVRDLLPQVYPVIEPLHPEQMVSVPYRFIAHDLWLERIGNAIATVAALLAATRYPGVYDIAARQEHVRDAYAHGLRGGDGWWYDPHHISGRVVYGEVADYAEGEHPNGYER